MSIKQYKVLNVKCNGCANTLIKSLKSQFGDVKVDLEVEPRVITLDIEDSQEETLKIKLRNLGYPLDTDELNTFETVTTTAKSFVSCAIGKINS